MDPLEFLKTRRSVSAAFLAPPAPDRQQLEEMLTIASRVPDHGKLTPWRFIVFEGDAQLALGDALAALYGRLHPEADEKKLDEERKRLATAPMVVAVVSKAGPHVKIPEWEQFLSAGNAAFALVLAAHALGFGANWTTNWIATEPEAGPVLGLAPDEKVVAFIHIGTPTAQIPDRPRPPLDDIVTYWQAP